MKKFYILILVFLIFGLTTNAQTTLISPTGDGGFENGSTFSANGWTVVNGATNQWFVGSVATPSSGTNSAYISDNTSGTTYNYLNTANSTVHFYRDVTFPSGETNIVLSFKWKASGEGNYDYITVYAMPTSVTPVVNTPTGGSQSWNNVATAYSGASLLTSPANLNLQSAYQTQTVCLPSSFAGTTRRLVFMWSNDGSGGSQPAGSVDSISLVSSTPNVPSNQATSLSLTPASTGQINGSFTAASGSTDGYLVVRYPSGGTPVAPSNYSTYTVGGALGTGKVVSISSSTTFSVSGLSPATTYDFYIYTYLNGPCGPIYLTSNPLTGSATTLSCSGLSGTYSVGPTGTYSTLTAAIAATASGLSGAVIFELESSYSSSSETFPITFPANACLNSTQTITVRPATGASSLVITSSNTTATINFDGANYITIDGRPGGSGTTSQLTISNTATGSAVAIKLINDASNNTIKYCNILGSTSSSFGVIHFGTGVATGNDNNTISNNNIGVAGTNYPLNGIYSLGTSATIDNSNNEVSNNNIYDYFNATAACYGIQLNSFNSAWTINNNRLYQTATRLFTSATTHYGIFVGSGVGYTINGNIIGYADASGTGTTNLVGNSTALTGTFPSSYTTTGTPNATRYVAINCAFTAGGTVSSIQGNTVAGFALFTSSGATTTYGILCGIQVTSGNVNIGTVTGNTIGATTGTGSIYTVCTTSGGAVVGIYVTSTNTVNIQNNTVGAIDAMGSTATIGGNITGINSAGTAGNFNISNNIIGNSTNPNLRTGNLTNGSNLSNSGTTFGTVSGVSILLGIFNQASGTVTINSNIVRNASINTTSTSTSAGFKGISISSGNYVISNNQINNLTTMCLQAGVGTGLLAGIGIYGSGGTVGSSITLNTINTLSLGSTTAAGTNVAGISIANTAVDISKNKIFDLSNGSTSVSVTAPGTASGIFIRSATSAGNMNIFNNMISLGAGQTTNTAFIGIWGNHGLSPNPNVNIYHNTINIEGSVTSGATPSFAFHRGNFAASIVNQVTMNIKNNIFINTRSGGTGKHYAIGNYYGATSGSNAVGWAAGASNNNVLNASSSTVGYWTTDQTLAGWQLVTGCDLSSISNVTVNFVNTTTCDLHLNFGATPTALESGGTLVSGYTTDFDNQNRPGPTGSVNGGAFNPDLGADEFDGVHLDIIPPAIVYSPLNNTSCTTGRSITAVISDYSNINISSGSKPRLWFKKINNANTLPSTNDNSTDGWKYTEAINASSPFNFNFDYTSVFGGVSVTDTIQYFIVAQDQANTPNVGIKSGTFNSTPSTVALSASSFPITGTIYNYAVNAATLTGTVTIGSTGTYPSLTGAGGLFAAINSSGLAGNLTVNILDATVAEDGSNTLIAPAYTCGGPYSILIKPGTGVTSTLSGSSVASIIKLLGADYITIDGSNDGSTSRNLTISNTNTGTASGVIWLASTIFGDGATNNTIKNCVITGNAPTTTLSGIMTSGSVFGGLAEGPNNNNTIQNNAISLSQYGVAIVGPTALESGNIIKNNDIGSTTSSIGLRNMFVSNQVGTQITGNTIQNLSTATSAASGLFLAGNTDGVTIANNTIKNLSSTATSSGLASVSAICVNTGNVNTTIESNTITGIASNATGGYGVRAIIVQANGTQIFNNMISDVYNYQDANPSLYATTGISLDGDINNVKIYHNTINLFGAHTGYSSNTTGGVATCLYVNTTKVGGLDIRNNIFSNTYENTTSTGDKTYAIYSTSPNTVFSALNYNDYYVGGASTTFLGYFNSDFSTLTDIQTNVGGNANSMVYAPTYNSNIDLHLSGANGINWCLNNSGESLSAVSKDFDGTSRNTGTGSNGPDLGADEFNISGDAVATPSTQNICSNNAITDIVLSGVATSYNWTRNNTASVTGIAASGTGNISGTLVNTTNATVTVTFTITPIISGCAGPQITANVTVYPTPTVSVNTSSQNVCNGGAISNITFSGTVSGTTFDWTRDNTDSISGISASGTGNISGSLTSIAKSSKTVTFTVTPKANGCSGTPVPVTVDVNLIPAITTSTPGVRCDAGTVNLNATSDFGTVNWYSAATGGTLLGTGNSFTTPSISVTTTFYAEAFTAFCSSNRTPVVATVNTTPTITSTTPAQRCDAGSITISAVGSAGTLSWYSASSGGTLLGTGNSLTISSLATTTTYYVEVSNLGCTSSRTAVTATINTTPSVTSTSGASRCDAGTVTLTASASAGNINWYASSIGGSILFTGNSYTPTVSTTTTFYAEAATATCSSARTPVIATVVPTPTFTSTTPGSRCDPGAIVIGATVNVGTISWFANPTGGTALGTGNTFITPSVSVSTTYYAEATNGACTTPTRTPVLAAISASLSISGVPGSRCDAGTVTLGASASGGVLSWYTTSSGGSAIATGSPFITPSLSTTTTYYVEANAGTCASARIPVVATINITPSITSTTPGSRCDAGTVVLGATASGGTISWYDAATGGTALGTGASFTTPSISTTTTYYVEASLGGCNNGRTAVTATVNTTPSITSTTPSSRCDAGTLTLNATADAGTIEWYANATGGVALGTGNSFTTPVISATTTYYVQTSTTTCASSRTAVTAQVTITPSITSTTPGSICGAGTVTLSATASSGATINWYDALTGGTLLGTGASFTTPSISNTTTYYVEATNSGCTFARTAVTATIKTIPTVTSVTPGSRCNSGTVVLLATTSAGNINWYTAATGGSPVGTGNTFTTPSLSATTIFYAEAANQGCFSTRTAVTATVNATPTITATAPASRCGTGTVVLGATASVGVLNWYIVPTGGTIIGTGATYTTPSISTTTTYYVEANNGGCVSSRLPIVATVNPIPTISATAGSRCDAGTVTLNASSNIGTISWFTTSTGGTAIATGPSYTTGSLSATTAYYVEAATATCTSSRIAVVANVYITPSILTTTPGSRCGTGAVTLRATASGGTILWYAAATGGTPIATGGTYAPTLAATTTFYVEANNNGCAQARVPVVATINQLPSAIIAGPQSVCANAVVYYSLGNVVGNIATYNWTCTGGTITSGQGTSAITVTWAAAGSGSLSCSMSTTEGCTAGTPSFPVTKNALPTPSFTGTTTVCTNTTYTYTASTSGNTYVWVPLDGAIVSQTGNTVDILWNNVTSSTLTLTEVLATGCSASSSQTITISGPVSATITGNGQVCNNSTQTYTLTGPTATSWTAVGGNITTSSATSATVQWNTVGVQSITANYTNGACSYSVTSTINVNALPTPVVIGSNHGCTGSTYTYSTINNGGRGFSWNVSANGTILNGQGTNTITVLWNTAGGGLVSVNETVIATGCSVTSGALVLNILNTPSSTISGLAVGCSGVPTTYTASTAATYAWSITGGVINGAANAQSVSVTWGTGISGALTLTSSNSSANGSCSSTTTLPVNINITPTPVITGPNSLCSGTTTAFTTAFNNRYNYTWNVINATYTFGGNNNVINVTPNSGATSVTISVTVNINGSTCTGTATKNLAVNLTPTISLSGNNNVCQNSTQTYTATGGSTYNFSVTSGSIVSTTANTVTVQWGLYSGAVNVTGASAAGCTGNATFPVNVNPLPGATIIGSAVVCANTTMNYSVASQAGMTYSWTVTGGNLVGSGSGNAITVNWGAAGTGSVKVSLTNTSLCNDSRTMNVSISAIPAPAITGASTVCQGATQTYSVTAAAGAAYNWSVTGGNVISGSGTNSITVLWTSAGNRNVAVAQSNGVCTGNANAAITVNAAPAIPTVFRAGAQLSTNAVATSYQWFKDGVAVTGATSATHIAASAGTYTVVVTNSSGCSTSSTGVIANVGIKNNTFMSNVNVFPNPASASITISALMKKSQDITLNIFDINGKLVYTTLSVNADLNFAKTISLDGLSSGIYVIQLVSAEGMIQERFVKE